MAQLEQHQGSVLLAWLTSSTPCSRRASSVSVMAIMVQDASHYLNQYLTLSDRIPPSGRWRPLALATNIAANLFADGLIPVYNFTAAYMGIWAASRSMQGVMLFSACPFKMCASVPHCSNCVVGSQVSSPLSFAQMKAPIPAISTV